MKKSYNCKNCDHSSDEHENNNRGNCLRNDCNCKGLI